MKYSLGNNYSDISQGYGCAFKVRLQEKFEGLHIMKFQLIFSIPHLRSSNDFPDVSLLISPLATDNRLG